MNGSVFYRDPEEGTNYLASVSDLMSGLIFVFIIALMVFALTFQESSQRVKVVGEELTNTQVIRETLLKDIQESLKRHGIEVEVDTDHGILRMPEDLLFESGEYRLSGRGQARIEVLASELALVAPCYAGKPDSETPEGLDCGEHWHPGRLDTILIEGHTDDARVVGSSRGFRDNWELSSLRAIETYKALTSRESDGALRGLLNRDGEPVIGVSGYADRRPVPGNPNTDAGSKAKNRRIDLRFVMAPPVRGHSAERILNRLTTE